MKRSITAFFTVLTIGTSCTIKPRGNDKMDRFIADRIWISGSKQQYYFDPILREKYTWSTMKYDSSVDTKYEGSTMAILNNDTIIIDNSLDRYSSPFSKAKGNPSSNSYREESLLPYIEGWSLSSNYTIINDSIIFQSPEDISAKDLSSYHILRGKDTTIGVLDYHTLIVTNEYERRIWRSKKK